MKCRKCRCEIAAHKLSLSTPCKDAALVCPECGENIESPIKHWVVLVIILLTIIFVTKFAL